MDRIPRIARAFEDTPEFRVPFDSSAFSSAYVNAVAAIHDGADMVLIVGPTGSGKSLLLRSVGDAVIRSRGIALCRAHPEGNLDETLEWLLGELRVVAGSTLRENRLQALAAFLDRQTAPVVLLVDDVDNSPDRTIVGLAALAIFRREEGNKLQIVLASGAEIDKRLQRPDLAWVADHVGARIYLDPLTREEVGPYIAHRIVATRRWLRGRAVDALAPDVVDRVGLYSAGLPRLINLLCRTAMRESRTIIDAAQIDRAARECGLSGPSLASTDDMPDAVSTSARPPDGIWILTQLRERRAVALRASCACAAVLILALAGVAFDTAPPDLASRASILHASVLGAGERLLSGARAVPGQLKTFAESVQLASRIRPEGPPIQIAMVDLQPNRSLVLQEDWLISDRHGAGAATDSQRSERSEPDTSNAMSESLALPARRLAPVPDSGVDVLATRDGLDEVNDPGANQAAAAAALPPGLSVDAPASAGPSDRAHTDVTPASAILEQESPKAVVDAPIIDAISQESASGALAVREPAQAPADITEPIREAADDDGQSEGPSRAHASGSGTESAPPLPVAVTPPHEATSFAVLEPSLEGTGDPESTSLPLPHAEQASASPAEDFEPQQPSLDVSAHDSAIRPTEPDISRLVSAPATSSAPVLAVELLMTRGDEMLRAGDPASARLFFERAAAQGHAGAMASVARTYDPVQLRRLRLISFNGHPKQAVEWYRRAIEAGDLASVEQLAALEQWMTSGRS